jgi:hypothetical protein
VTIRRTPDQGIGAPAVRPYDPGGRGAPQEGSTVTTVQDRITDPGFTTAMDETEAAIAELRALGVPMDSAVTVVQRVYSSGRDRGLYLGLRLAHTPPATA